MQIYMQTYYYVRLIHKSLRTWTLICLETINFNYSGYQSSAIHSSGGLSLEPQPYHKGSAKSHK